MGVRSVELRNCEEKKQCRRVGLLRPHFLKPEYELIAGARLETFAGAAPD